MCLAHFLGWAAYAFNYIDLSKTLHVALQMTLKWPLKTWNWPLVVFDTLKLLQACFFSTAYPTNYIDLHLFKNRTLTSLWPQMTSKWPLKWRNWPKSVFGPLNWVWVLLFSWFSSLSIVLHWSFKKICTLVSKWP